MAKIDATTCGGCGERVELPDEVLADVLAVAHAAVDPRAGAFSQFAGMGTVHTQATYARNPLHLRAHPGHPLCERCATPLTVDGASDEGVLAITCAHCKETVRYPIAASLHRIAPTVAGWMHADCSLDEGDAAQAAPYRERPQRDRDSVWVLFRGESKMVATQLEERRREKRDSQIANQATRAVGWFEGKRAGVGRNLLFQLPFLVVAGLVAAGWSFVSELSSYQAEREHASWRPATCTLLRYRDVGTKQVKRYWTASVEVDGNARTFELDHGDTHVPTAAVVRGVEPNPTPSDRSGSLFRDKPLACFAAPTGDRAVLFRATGLEKWPLVWRGLAAVGCLLLMLLFVRVLWATRRRSTP